MSATYTRCKFISGSQECETWFPVDGNKFCAIHRSIPSTNGSEEQLKSYIDLANQDRSFVANMSFEEIDNHISNLQAQMEDLKRQMLQARAVKSERIERLTEEERRELRKKTLNYEVQKQPKEPKPKTIEEKIAKTLKTNVGVANDLLTMDIDELMKKYQKAKEKE